MTGAVFISHSSRDRKVSETLCQALEQRGIACWVSSRDIGAGQNFQEAIVHALSEARVMLLVFTANANNSDEIKKELALASQYRVFVIPVRVEDVLPSDAFRYELATRQWIDLFEDWERALGHLAEQIRVALGADPTGAAPPAAAPRRSRGLPWLAGGALAAIAIAAGGIVLERGAAPAPVVTGTWISDPVTSPYAADDKYTLQATFEQAGDSLSGSITEITSGGRASTPLREGRVKDGHVSFVTLGEAMLGDETRPYRETYEGRIEGGAIALTRQNDLPTGGEIEHLAMHRK